MSLYPLVGTRLRTRHLPVAAIAACLLWQLSPIHAATLQVGPSAGLADSACDFATIAEAVAALPADGITHFIEVEVADYHDDRIVLDGPLRQLVVRRAFAQGSDCSAPANGSGVPALVGTAGADAALIVLRGGARLWLEDMVARNNGARGAQVIDSDLDLLRSRIESNTTRGDASGAGIAIEGGSLRIEDSTMRFNQAAGTGGAIFCGRGSGPERTSIALLGHNTFTANVAQHSGGAIQLHEACHLVVDDEAGFIGNLAAGDGGAIAAAAQPDTAQARNVVLFMTGPTFERNSAGGNGGAILLDAAASLRSIPDGEISHYLDNRARGEGGAIAIVGGGPPAILVNARFFGNAAVARGGALAVRDRDVLVDAACPVETLDANRYCTEFRGNGFVDDVPASLRQGGALYVSNAILRVREGAFLEGIAIDDRAPGAAGVTDGALAWVEDGFLLMASSLVARTAVGVGAQTHLFDFGAGGIGILSFNTLVDNGGGAVIHAGEDASVTLVGNIVDGNAFGVDGPGFIGGTCNNAQLGTEPAPLDPRFTSTPRGDYRLAAHSPMIDLGFECRTDALPDGFVLPRTDLDGYLRVLPGDPEWAIDAGAFELRKPGDRIFRSGFEVAL